MNNICIILYTHESYQDIFNISIKLHEKYSKCINIIVFSNKNMNNQYPHILYDDSQTYPQRINNCLNKLPSNITHIILTHDWALMYGDIDIAKITNIIEIMITKKINQIRLLRAAVGGEQISLDRNIYTISNDGLLFSLQPTIWEIETLKKITNENQGFNYRDIEEGLQIYMRQFINCFYYEGEDKFPGAGHHKSNIFPHIHSTRYGKWIINENIPYIYDIITEFNIDISKRGVI
jgi:hypothetical protein